MNTSADEARSDPAESIKLVYTSGFNELNSVEGYIQKDLGVKGTARAAFLLSSFDKSRIYQMVTEMKLQDYPSEVGDSTKEFGCSLWIEWGNHQKKISWIIDKSNAVNDLEWNLIHLQNILDDALFNNGIYKSMPPSEPRPQ